MLQTCKQIYQQLLDSKKILLVPHQNPDGDALGSAGAMREFLRSVKKEAVVFCVTPVLPRFHFIPHARAISADARIFEQKDIDAIVVLDSGDLHYAGIAELVKGHPAKIINIDHHHTNGQYGDFNLIAPDAAATAEVLYYFFRHNNININQVMATALLTGLVTDTDNFSNGATSTAALLAGSELLRCGGNLKLINNCTVRDKTLNALKLWGTAFTRLARHEPTDITYTFLTQKDLKDFGATEADAEGVANFLNNLSGSKISLILKETADNKIKGSLRTTQENVDVSALAKKLGGGGHKKAAGFTAEGTIEEVLKKILQK